MRAVARRRRSLSRDMPPWASLSNKIWYNREEFWPPSRVYSAWHTFSKVRALVHLLYKAIIEMTFENACPQQLQYGRLFGNLEGQYAQFVFDGNIGVVI